MTKRERRRKLAQTAYKRTMSLVDGGMAYGLAATKSAAEHGLTLTQMLGDMRSANPRPHPPKRGCISEPPADAWWLK